MESIDLDSGRFDLVQKDKEDRFVIRHQSKRVDPSSFIDVDINDVPMQTEQPEIKLLFEHPEYSPTMDYLKESSMPTESEINPHDPECEVLDLSSMIGRQQDQKEGSEAYVLVEEDEQAINEFHRNHKVKKESTFKQKLFQKITNIGFKYFKNGDSRLLAGKKQQDCEYWDSKDSVVEAKPKFNSQELQSTYQSSKCESLGLTLMGFQYFSSDRFYQEYKQLIWITYRRHFRPLLIEKIMYNGKKVQNLTTDNNWGCTIRAAQMVLANAIRLGQPELSVPEILQLFDDSSRGCKESAFSIQNVVVEGLQYDKLPGEWYGVGNISHIMERLADKYHPLQNFVITTFQDGNLILDYIQARGQSKINEKESIDEKDQIQTGIHDVFEFEQSSVPQINQSTDLRHSKNQSSSETPKPIDLEDERGGTEEVKGQEIVEEWKNQVLAIVNVRLGFETVHEEYFPSILNCMKMPQFVGLIGGKPRKAFYFVGAKEVEQKLIFLDPHLVHRHVPDLASTNQAYYAQFPGKFHCHGDARMIHLSKLDPCMGFAYLIKNRADFESFKDLMCKLQAVNFGSNVFNLFMTQDDFLDDVESQQVRSVYSNSVRMSMLPPTD